MITKEEVNGVRSLISECFGVEPTGERIDGVPVYARQAALCREQRIQEEVDRVLECAAPERSALISAYGRSLRSPWTDAITREFSRDVLTQLLRRMER